MWAAVSRGGGAGCGCSRGVCGRGVGIGVCVWGRGIALDQAGLSESPVRVTYPKRPTRPSRGVCGAGPRCVGREGYGVLVARCRVAEW